MSTPRLALLDAPSFSSRRLLRCLEAGGYRVQVFEEELELLGALDEQPPALLVVAADRAGEALAEALAARPDRPGLVLLDDLDSLAACAPALVALASETLTRPVGDEHALEVVRAALERHALSAENARLRAGPEEDGFSGVVSQDRRMRRIFATIEAVADSRATLLIQGESGTGKTVLARAAHVRSTAKDAPFVVVNCGALPGSLLESELFGHVRGAFTGAVKDRAGKFEAADGGTIFLDEIGTASHDLQVKLLRVIEEGTFERVGESVTRRVEVRVIAATNVDLAEEVDAGRFRADLYYRLNVVPLRVPPLRERPGDVALLAERFLRRFAERHRRAVDGFASGTLARLCAHPWPGNVRELENTVERAVLLAREALLAPADLWPDLDAEDDPAEDAPGRAPRLEDLPLGPLREVLETPERWLVERALRVSHGCRKQAAAILGINRTTLFNKMRKYALFSAEVGADEDAEGPEELGRTG